MLAVEAAACVVLSIAFTPRGALIASVIAFPLEQIGLGLRALSLSGGPGNVAAIVLYAAICLLPAALLLAFARKRPLRAEDALLGLASAVLFAVLYFMINPATAVAMLTGGMGDQMIIKAMLGGAVYSVLFGYVVLRVLRLFSEGSTNKLLSYMSVLLGALGVVFVYLAFGARLSHMVGAVASLRAGNAGNEHLLGASYVFLALRFAVDALPHILDVLVVLAALRLLYELRIDRYSAESVEAALRMSKLCALVLAMTVLSSVCFNVLTLLFASSLRVINITVRIPVLSIAFVLAALLLTRFVAENKELKDDNDMFI